MRTIAAKKSRPPSSPARSCTGQRQPGYRRLIRSHLPHLWADFGESIVVGVAALLIAATPAAGTTAPTSPAPQRAKHVLISKPTPPPLRSQIALVNQQALHQNAAHDADVAAYEQALVDQQAAHDAAVVAYEQALVAQQAAQAIAAQQAQQAKVVPPDNPADATSVDTSDWACIRNAESSGNYTDISGAYGDLLSTWSYYGFSGTPGQATPAVQDAFALKLFALNGYKFAGSWNDPCTMNGGPLR